jgi:hypothetical protein
MPLCRTLLLSDQFAVYAIMRMSTHAESDISTIEVSPMLFGYTGSQFAILISCAHLYSLPHLQDIKRKYNAAFLLPGSSGCMPAVGAEACHTSDPSSITRGPQPPIRGGVNTDFTYLHIMKSLTLPINVCYTQSVQ